MGSFVWHELLTSDLDGARDFYAAVAGWRVEDSGMPGMRYLLGHAGAVPVCGLMAFPEGCLEASLDESERTGWLGYVGVPDVEAAAEQVRQAGGAIRREPDDIPGIGRFAIAADPEGTVFILFRPSAPPPSERPAPGTPGLFAWNELHARDGETALAFYAGLLGWQKMEAVDMGAMGTYQCFGLDGVAIGGAFSDPSAAKPHWLHYVAVEDIDAGAARVTKAGGTVAAGPHPVPGGAWIIHARDPQGGAFALVGPRAAG
jgi:uncharacterized protein